MEAVDTLISARWVIPIEPAGCVLERHTIAVRQGRIVAVLPNAAAEERYTALERIDRPTHVLLPGFINAQVTIPPALQPTSPAVSTSIFSDASVDTWLDPELVNASSELVLARLIASGTTCFAGGSHGYPEILARTAAALQMRACITLPILEQPLPWAVTADECFEKALSLHDEYRDDPLIMTAFATGSTPGLRDATLQRLRLMVDEIELPVLIPLHADEAEIAESTERFGCRPLTRLERLGLATPQLLGTCLMRLNETDLAILSYAGAHAVLCPGTRLDVEGDPPSLPRLHGEKVNIALSTDTSPDTSLFGQLRVATLLTADIKGSEAPDLLHMATLGGAQALGLANATGSLVPGKWADLCCINFASMKMQPVHDVISQLYFSTPDQVTDVWVAGRSLLSAGRLTRLDITATLERIARWQS